MKRYMTALIHAALAVIASADTLVFTNGSDNIYWDDPASWGSGAVPTSGTALAGAQGSGGNSFVVVTNGAHVKSIAMQNTPLGIRVDGSDASLTIHDGDVRMGWGGYQGGKFVVCNGALAEHSGAEFNMHSFGAPSTTHFAITNGGAFHTAGKLKLSDGASLTHKFVGGGSLIVDGDLELLNEPITRGTPVPNNKFLWDGIGTFRVGGNLYNFGPQAHETEKRGAGAVNTFWMMGHPSVSIAGDYYQCTNVVGSSAAPRTCTSVLKFTGLNPGSRSPILQAAGTAHLGGNLDLGGGDWIQCFATDDSVSPVTVLRAGTYDGMFENLIPPAGQDSAFSMSMAAAGVQVAVDWSKVVVTNELSAGEISPMYGTAANGKIVSFLVLNNDRRSRELVMYLKLHNSAFSSTKPSDKIPALTPHIGAEALEDDPDGFNWRITIPSMRNATTVLVQFDFSSMCFGSQDQNMTYLYYVKIGQRDESRGTAVIIR